MSIHIIDVLYEPMKLYDASSRGHAIDDIKWEHVTGICFENPLTVLWGVNIGKGKSKWRRLKEKDNRSEREMNWLRNEPKRHEEKIKWERQMQQMILPYTIPIW